MSSYTMQLRTIIEQATQYERLSTREQIEKGRSNLFDFDYPIFNEDYRNVFETHFIRNFYMREIGTETEGLFKFNLETWLIINMPYFNKLFESELIKYDPLINTKMDITHNKKNDRKQNDQRDSSQESETLGTSNTKGTAKNDTTNTTEKNSNGSTVSDDFERDLESNNPDQRLAITTNDGQGMIEFASKINESNQNNKTTATGKETGSGTAVSTDNTTNDTTANANSTAKAIEKANTTINDIEEFIEQRIGKTGSATYSSMVTEYRSTLLRIEKQIFKEMQELFMLVY